MTYQLIFRLVLRRIPAEIAHRLAEVLLGTLGRIPPLRSLVRRILGPRDPALGVSALGLQFPSPLGVAAGVDKSATWFEGLGSLGFGFVEVGTITARAQPGNARPRIHRLTGNRALLNSMGFPNPGAEAAARRLRRRSGQTVVGINVGRSKDAEDAGADYRLGVRQLAPAADFVVINVSSPNTPGLRMLQQADLLEGLVDEVFEELAALGLTTPVLIKIAPDMSDEQVDAVAELAVRSRVAGIVAVNTTTSRDGVAGDARVLSLPGGISGAPLKARAEAVLERLYRRTGGEVVLISVGGIETAADVWERVRAGATLVQAYTGFIYGGPLWPHRINRELGDLVRQSGAETIQELVGSAHRADASPRPRSQTLASAPP